jgi:heme-degrading monooxygenase HmoA
LGQLYTHGRWMVKEGQQERFQAAWQELAGWTNANISGAVAGEARLLHDLDDPTLFYSFGPWDSLDAIQAWRADPGFQERVGRIREFLESFEAHTLRLVVQRGESAKAFGSAMADGPTRTDTAPIPI